MVYHTTYEYLSFAFCTYPYYTILVQQQISPPTTRSLPNSNYTINACNTKYGNCTVTRAKTSRSQLSQAESSLLLSRFPHSCGRQVSSSSVTQQCQAAAQQYDIYDTPASTARTLFIYCTLWQTPSHHTDGSPARVRGNNGRFFQDWRATCPKHGPALAFQGGGA